MFGWKIHVISQFNMFIITFYYQECLSSLLSTFAVAGKQSLSLQKFVSSVLDPDNKSTQTFQAFANALSCYFKVLHTWRAVQMNIFQVILTFFIFKVLNFWAQLTFPIIKFLSLSRNTKHCCHPLKRTLSNKVKYLLVT